MNLKAVVCWSVATKDKSLYVRSFLHEKLGLRRRKYRFLENRNNKSLGSYTEAFVSCTIEFLGFLLRLNLWID